MLNGSIVTQTGSKKSVELPEGQHTLEIIDPKTGLTHREKIFGYSESESSDRKVFKSINLVYPCCYP